MKGTVIAPALGPKSRRSRLAVLDQRTQEAAYIRRVRAELLAHVGPNASVTQRAIVERAAILSLFCAQFDSRALLKGGLSLHDSREYLSYSNALSRTLRHLGLKRNDHSVAASPAPVARLAEVMQQVATEGDEA